MGNRDTGGARDNRSSAPESVTSSGYPSNAVPRIREEHAVNNSALGHAQSRLGNLVSLPHSSGRRHWAYIMMAARTAFPFK